MRKAIMGRRKRHQQQGLDVLNGRLLPSNQSSAQMHKQTCAGAGTASETLTEMVRNISTVSTALKMTPTFMRRH